MTSAKEIVSINPRFIKIPSACNTNFDMLGYICDNYDGEIQLSFGMTTKDEEEQIVKFFEEAKEPRILCFLTVHPVILYPLRMYAF